jgi:hypothetical protein
MKNSLRTIVAISLLAFSQHGAYAAPNPKAVRLTTAMNGDVQLDRLVRLNNSCVDSLLAGDNETAKRLCKAALARMLSMNGNALAYYMPARPVHELTLAAVYNNYALARWKDGDAVTATRLLAAAKEASPSASFVLTNEPLFEAK